MDMMTMSVQSNGTLTPTPTAEDTVDDSGDPGDDSGDNVDDSGDPGDNVADSGDPGVNVDDSEDTGDSPAGDVMCAGCPNGCWHPCQEEADTHCCTGTLSNQNCYDLGGEICESGAPLEGTKKAGDIQTCLAEGNCPTECASKLESTELVQMDQAETAQVMKEGSQQSKKRKKKEKKKRKKTEKKKRKKKEKKNGQGQGTASTGNCANLRAAGLKGKVQRAQINLQYPILNKNCNEGAETPACYGVFYAGNDKNAFHAVLYNANNPQCTFRLHEWGAWQDKGTCAMVALQIFNGQNRRVKTVTFRNNAGRLNGHMSIRGLAFSPDGSKLVAYFGGGRKLSSEQETNNARKRSGTNGAKSYVVAYSIPGLRQLWKKRVWSNTNVMELSVAGMSQNLVVTNAKIFIYTTGMGPVGPAGYTWGSGGCCHQWSYMWQVNLRTGTQKRGSPDAEGPTFASHSLSHGAAFSPKLKKIVSFHSRDAKDSFVLSSVNADNGNKVGSTQRKVWGGGYASGVTPGYVAASTRNNEFGVVVTIGCSSKAGDRDEYCQYRGCATEGRNSFVPLSPKDKVFFMKVNGQAKIQGQPKQLFQQNTQVAAALQPLPDGRWLLAYTQSSKDLWENTNQYADAHGSSWLASSTRNNRNKQTSSKLAILERGGKVQGSVTLNDNQKLPKQYHHLVRRGSSAFGWAHVNPGARKVTVMKLVC